MSDFRTVLRRESRQDHDRVDALFSTLDLTSRDDLTAFFLTHHACFAAMMGCDCAPQTQDLLADMTARLACDLSALDARAHPPEVSIDIQPDPLAIDYMVAGSRLGTAVLRKTWAAATDPQVRQASAYFAMIPTPGYWPGVCARLVQVPAPSARASQIVADVRTLFDLFATTHLRQSRHFAESLSA